MQLDMFGGDVIDEIALNESALPILEQSGAWIRPEVLALNAALKRGVLSEAMHVLKSLKVADAVTALLGSGFSVHRWKTHKALFAGIQTDLLAAVREKRTGRELWSSRVAMLGDGSVQPNTNIEIGDPIRHAGQDYTVTAFVDGGIACERSVVALGNGVSQTTGLILKGEDAYAARIEAERARLVPLYMLNQVDVEVASKMHTGMRLTDVIAEQARLLTLASLPIVLVDVEVASKMYMGMRVVDGAGTQYYVFGTHKDCVKVFPLDENGKEQVYDGNALYYHIDPETAIGYSDRRHDPLYLMTNVGIATALESAQKLLNNTHTTLNERDGNDGTDNRGISETELVLAAIGDGNRSIGSDGHRDRESVDDGMGAASKGSSQVGRIFRPLAESDGIGIDDTGERIESAAPGSARDHGGIRDRGAAANGLTNALSPPSAGAVDLADPQLRDDTPRREPGHVEVLAQKHRVVNVPLFVSQIISSEISMQEAKLLELRGYQTSAALEDTLNSINQIHVAENVLREMRVGLFAVEDDAVAAIEKRQLLASVGPRHLFPASYALVAAHIATMHTGLETHQSESTPDWQVIVPSFGLAMEDNRTGTESLHQIASLIADEAIAHEQRFDGGSTNRYAYLMPALGRAIGRVRLLPDGQPAPAGWIQLSQGAFCPEVMSERLMHLQLLKQLDGAPISNGDKVQPALVEVATKALLREALAAGHVVALANGSHVRMTHHALYGWNYSYNYEDARHIWSEGTRKFVPGAVSRRSQQAAIEAAVDEFERVFRPRSTLAERSLPVLEQTSATHQVVTGIVGGADQDEPAANVTDGGIDAVTAIAQTAVAGNGEGATDVEDAVGNGVPMPMPMPMLAATQPAGVDIVDGVPDLNVADYVITQDDAIGIGGLKDKFKNNVKAIEVLKLLEIEKRRAVGGELRTLARYVGWGGLKGVFDPQNKQWNREHLVLRALLSDAQWRAASRSQLDAFYTSTIVAKAMYSAVGRLGFKDGRILEPSVGVGNFFGLMPEAMRLNSTLHGVEMDILTSEIVAALYPNATIAKATGFEDYQVPAGYFDLVIGNPPFGSQAVSDRNGSIYSGWSIHNYFFAKSIEMLAPGGIMSMVVSHNFLDKLDPHVRLWIARRAELVSGVRLPKTAFQSNANTEVVTDILVFRRLDNENMLGHQELPDWLNTTDIALKNVKTGDVAMIAVNDYFINNPDNVLGVNSSESSMYRANEYTVLPNGDLEAQLAGWVARLPEGIYVPVVRSARQADLAAVDIPEMVKVGSFFERGGAISRRTVDELGSQRSVPWEPANQRSLDRMTGMIRIRDTLRRQMQLERSLTDDWEVERGRSMLNSVYDAFQKNYGFLNDQINRRIFIDDTESPLIQALEFDYEKAVTPAKAEEYGIGVRPARAVKADILSHRVLFPPLDVEIVHSAKDALLHSLNVRGCVDITHMESAYGKSQNEIVEELGDLLFMDPVDGLVTSDQYLSGDVKTKLAEAVEALKYDAALARNVEALARVIPANKLPSQIHASLGAAWIPPAVFSAFAKEVSGADTKYHYVKDTGQWLPDGFGGIKTLDFVKNNTVFGTEDIGALEIVELMMNSRAPEVKMKIQVDGVDRMVTNEPATEAVRACADKLRAHWDSWLWQDGARGDALASIYNDRFNRTVSRNFDGLHMTFPGMNPMLTMLDHQKNGVWRGLQDRSLLLDHVVGAGKTYEMVALVMEMRRLGIAKKPLIAVPNHLTLQWRTEFYRLYPGANVLAATPQDFDKDGRERFFSKIVTGNWDAVIIGHASLKKIAVPHGVEMQIITEQHDDIVSAIEDIKRERGDRNIVRDMEKTRATMKAKIDKLIQKGGVKDNVVDFGDLGVDMICIDEMHEFKNLMFTTQMSRISGLGNPTGSGKAFDLFVKIRWLKEVFGDKAPLIAATGTPISNSLAEMYTIQRYMQYSKLKSNDLHVFDAWAKQYGDVQNVYEVAPSGSGYRMSQRFAHYKNLGSLMGEYLSFADVVTLNDLKAQEIKHGKVFPVPKLLGDGPINIVAKRSPLQEKFFGIPEIVRNHDGSIKFSVDLSLPLTIETMEDGKFAMVQTVDGYDHRSKIYDTFAEVQEMIVLGAITPVMTVDPDSIVGKFDRIGALTRETKGKVNALSLTSLANNGGLDYRLIDPGAPDFPGSKVNLAIENLLRIGKTWEADKGVQLIFCDLSVPLSAKAKMASKELIVFVRDEDGALTHKKGTLHTVKNFEGFPYYLVPVIKDKEKTLSMYDAITGMLIRGGFDNKRDTHQFVANFFEKEDSQDRWLAQRAKHRVIDTDEIDDYKNERAMGSDIECGPNEISREDIEGVAGTGNFSIYDDMKAKLMAGGVPEAQIEFIHDHDTPQAKDLLFKRVNDGDVRYLFGSTPKMGAGTNVQKRFVAMHQIDAPWRPSDLEQREGRGIRRGNLLYERDPVNFRVEMYRYATDRTYDTRRWQLLEHKAKGLDQLRCYTGGDEIEECGNEASNSADMKAAASGNPLILKETQLKNDVKRLRLLERSHRDTQYAMRGNIAWHIGYATGSGKARLTMFQAFKETVGAGDALGMYKGAELPDKEAVLAALEDIDASLVGGGAKNIRYRGLDFVFKRENLLEHAVMRRPDDSVTPLEKFSPSGVVTRMDNWIAAIDVEIKTVGNKINASLVKAKDLEGILGLPFDGAEKLLGAIEEHGKVQRSLMQDNALAAVKPEEKDEFDAAVANQKLLLRSLGLGDVVVAVEADVVVAVEADVVVAVEADAIIEVAELVDNNVWNAVAVVPMEPFGAALGGIQARMVESFGIAVPADAGAVVMNAARPLVGDLTTEGPFCAGCFYSVILPGDEFGLSNIETNRKLDARVLVEVDRATQMKLAMHGSKDVKHFMSFDEEERFDQLAGRLRPFHDMPLDQLLAKIAEAVGVVKEGFYNGKILSVSNEGIGVVTQRINRDGETVLHKAGSLSANVVVGEIATIHYNQGVGIVTRKERGVGLDLG
jgi:N12 class adenine-specific DNA methylase